SHEDADATLWQGSEGVLVGDIIAQVDGDRVVLVQMECPKQVAHRPALVPLQPGLDLKDHLARRDLERLWMLAEGGIDALFDVGSLCFGYQAVMHCHRKLLGLKHNAWNVGQLDAKP